jgi:hypothetical protein
MNTAGTGRHASTDEGRLAPGPELPTDRAFVLQLSRETGPTLEPFAGRVEHLATGRRTRFATFEEFRAAMIRLLGEASEE